MTSSGQIRAAHEICGLGVTIETDGATVFQDIDDSDFANPDDFWNAISDGSLIKAKGTETSSQTITADEVEIQE